LLDEPFQLEPLAIAVATPTIGETDRCESLIVRFRARFK
jgi:hypothetical protein